LLAVNKIDLVDYDQQVFDSIAIEFSAYAKELGIHEVTAIPISALNGDNVVTRSERIGWYTGPSVLEHLENVDLTDDSAQSPLRFPVQYVIRPRSDALPDYRGYAGRVAAGTVRPGDEVVALPSGLRSTVTAIDTADGERDSAVAGESVTLLLADDLDLSRGDLISGVAGAPESVTEFSATITQLAERPLRAGTRALLRYGTSTTRVVVSSIDHLLEIDSLTFVDPPKSLSLNDIAQVTLRTADALPVEPYRPGGAVGSLLIIDPADGTTLSAGMVGDRRAALHPISVTPETQEETA
jgi:sulfate adenylyltransferase subunit 1